MSTPGLPSTKYPREFEEIEFVHPDGQVEILEFDVGTPEPVIQEALRKYTEEVSGQRVVPPISEFGRMTAAQGALTELDRAKSGVTPAPAPIMGGPEGFFAKPDEYIGHALEATATWPSNQFLEATADPLAYFEKVMEVLSAPSRGVQIGLSGGYEDLAAAERPPFARALESGFARASSFVPAAAGVIEDLRSSGGVPQTNPWFDTGAPPPPPIGGDPEAQRLYEISQNIRASAEGIPLEGPRTVFEIDSPEAMTQWFFNVLGEQTPIVMGLVGAGTLAGPAALFPASATLGTGIVAQQQLEKRGEVDPRSAIVGGAISGALDALPIMAWLKRTHVGDEAVQWIGSRAKAMISQTAEEMPTEYAQELVEALATEFVASRKDEFTGREWEEALRVIKQTQPEAISAAAAAGVIGPLMGAMGGGGGAVSSQDAAAEILRQKMQELEGARRVSEELERGTQVKPRSLEDIIRTTIQQRQAQEPAAPAADQGFPPPLGSSPEVTRGPTVPPFEPAEPTEPPPVPEKEFGKYDDLVKAAREIYPRATNILKDHIKGTVTINGGLRDGGGVQFNPGDPGYDEANAIYEEFLLRESGLKKQPEEPPAAAPQEPAAPPPAAPQPEATQQRLQAAHQFKDTGEVVVTGAIHQMPVGPDGQPMSEADVELGFFDTETGQFLTRKEALDLVRLEQPVSDQAKAGKGLDAADLMQPGVSVRKEGPIERRGPGRPEIPEGLRGDEIGRLKGLLREGKMDEAEALIDEIERKAETDSMTGLRNQNAHLRAVEEAPEGARHLYVDLDDFKKVNDRYGHGAGDEILRQFGDMLRAVTQDVEGIEGFRRGGDEFAILAVQNQDQLERIADLVRAHAERFEVAIELEDGSEIIEGVGVSYGIGQSLEEADRALYEDKARKGERAAARAQAAEPAEEPAAEPAPAAAGREPGRVGREGAERPPRGEGEVQGEEAVEPELEAEERRPGRSEKMTPDRPLSDAERAIHIEDGLEAGLTNRKQWGRWRAFAREPRTDAEIREALGEDKDLKFLDGDIQLAGGWQGRYVTGKNPRMILTHYGRGHQFTVQGKELVTFVRELLDIDEAEEGITADDFEIGDRVEFATGEGPLRQGFVRNIDRDAGEITVSRLGTRRKDVVPIENVQPYEPPEGAGRLPWDDRRSQTSGSSFVRRMNRAKTIDELDEIMAEAVRAGVGDQKQVLSAYRRKKDGLEFTGGVSESERDRWPATWKRDVSGYYSLIIAYPDGTATAELYKDEADFEWAHGQARGLGVGEGARIATAELGRGTLVGDVIARGKSQFKVRSVKVIFPTERGYDYTPAGEEPEQLPEEQRPRAKAGRGAIEPASRQVAPAGSIQPEPNTVYAHVRDMDGKFVGVSQREYDGTEEGMRAAARQLRDGEIEVTFPTWSNINTVTIATDADANPTWVISPNGNNIAPIDTEAGEYIAFGPRPEAPAAAPRELSPAGGALNVITRDLEKWEAALDRTIEAVDEKPFNLVDFTRLRSQITDWWDGIPEGMVKEAARQRYTNLVERLRAERNRRKEPKAKEDKVPLAVRRFRQQLEEAIENDDAQRMEEIRNKLNQWHGVAEPKDRSVRPHYLKLLDEIVQAIDNVGKSAAAAAPETANAENRAAMRKILERGGIAISPRGVDYRVKQGPNGWFYEERDGSGTVYTKGGGGPNKWSQDMAIEKVLDLAFPADEEIAPEAPEIAPEPEAIEEPQISEPEEAAPAGREPASELTRRDDLTPAGRQLTERETQDWLLMTRLADRLISQKPLSEAELFRMADEVYEGTRAEGTYQESDVYDVLEAAANQTMMRYENIRNEQELKDLVQILDENQAKLPKQPSRTKERDDLQQFSTPPSYAAVVAWAANIGPTDTVLEPSAGTGNIVTQAWSYHPARIVGNELSARRANLLDAVDGVDKVYQEDADHLSSVLHGKERPTVIVMNPPFSRNARMAGKRQIQTGLRHVLEAVKLVEPGGRVVAILGGGMSNAGPQGGAHHEAPKYRKAFGEIRAAGGDLKVNVRVPGKVYSTHGTSFHTRLVVIDKLPEGQQVLIGRSPIDKEVASLEELTDILSEVRNARVHPAEVQKPPAREGGRQRAAEAGEDLAEEQAGDAATPDADAGAVAGAEPGRGRRAPGLPPVAGREDATGGVQRPATDDQAAVGDTDVGEGARERGAARPGERDSGSGAQRPGEPGRGVQGRGPDALTTRRLEERKVTNREDEEGSIFSRYSPSVAVEGSQPHPAPLAESLIMGTIQPPEVDYTPDLPKEVIESGGISAAQLEPIIYAGAAHSTMLPDGKTRKGFFTGDGTGVGKTRIIGGIILDNWRQGRHKAVVLSPDNKLFEDFRTELEAIGFPIHAMFKPPQMGQPITRDEGILFITYATLISAPKGQENVGKQSRLEQVLEWMGEDFDGVLAFDEAHRMGNSIAVKQAIGTSKPAKQAVTGYKLQESVPNARVVYASATGATKIENLAFAARLGLWGPGTPFADRKSFVADMGAGGIAAMEAVAQDMKRLGVYLARNLVLDVQYEQMVHELTPEQLAMYDEIARAWRIIFSNMEKALEATGAVTINDDGRRVSSAEARNARSQFYGQQQLFFSTLLTSMKMPTLINSIEADLKAGHAPVIQVKLTGEAALARVLAQNLSADELQDVEVNSMGIVMHYLESSFPVALVEEYTDEEGNLQTRYAKDSNGDIITNPDAVRMREELLDRLGAMRMPELPIDQIISHFGADRVAEVTGRSKRLIYDDKGKRVIQSRTNNNVMADVKAFQAGKKDVLVFSMDAGGTGHSYHAGLNVKNQKLRRHYVLEGGWRADQAIQALGRTHRANQAQPPVWILLSTNLAGEKRFISTVARRLQQLGALTKGSKEASGQDLYSELDNLETPYAAPALHAFFRSLEKPGAQFGLGDFQEMTGLKITDDGGGLLAEGGMPKVSRFMNRVLALPPEDQARVFNGFISQYEIAINEAKRLGEYDTGTETIKSDKARVEHEEVAWQRENVKAYYLKIKVSQRTKPVTWDAVREWNALEDGPRFFRNERSGNVYAAIADREGTEKRSGRVVEQYRLLQPNRSMNLVEKDSVFGKNWKELIGQEAKDAWNEGIKKVPDYRESDLHMISGAMLPIWDRLPRGQVKIFRVVLDDGRQVIGRVIPADEVKDTLKNLGAAGVKLELTPTDVFDRVMSEGVRVELSNGWAITRRQVRGENRIELLNVDYSWMNSIKNWGVLSERINYSTRYFIPAVKPKGPQVLEEVLRGQDITDVVDPNAAVPDAGGDLIDQNTDFYSMADPLGGMIAKLAEAFQARRPPELNPIFVPPQLRHQVDSVEERKAAARRGALEETTREKAAKAADEVKRSFRSSFEYIDPNQSATMALTTDILRQYRAAPQYGRAVAYDAIRNITEGLDAERLVLFTDYLALGDIIKDVEAGLYEGRKELPFGYSHESLGEFYDEERDIETDYARVKGIVEANPEVLEAVKRRQRYQRNLTQELVRLEILRPEVLDDERYYHRQVLEHLNARTQFPLGATAGPDVHMRKKSFQKKRAGGSDFNLAYHEAEFEYLAQAMAQISKVQVLERLREIHDQVPVLKQSAKELNRIRAEQEWAKSRGMTVEEARAQWSLKPATHPTFPFRSKIALANQRLGKLASENMLFVPGFDHVVEELRETYDAWQEEKSEREELAGPFSFDHEDWFKFLAALAAQPDADIDTNPGPIMAMSIFKNIRLREELIKETLGRSYATWRTLAKDLEGYTTWQPQEGNHFFFSHTIPDKVLDQVLAGEKILQEEDVRDMLVIGGPRETWVIPEGLAKTLDNWGPRDEGLLEDASRWLLSSWKQWVLLNPLRAVRYNFNNQSGDLDIVLAYDPRILKGFDQAARDLWDYQVKGKASSKLNKEIEEAIKAGVVDSGLTVYEIPDIKRTGAFRALVDTNDPNAFQRAAETYWHGVKNLTTWRENILRLAAYRYFQEQVAAGKKVYGASNRLQVDALEGDAKAAKLARELIGDYGNISAGGQWLRGHLIPFYSWLEINAPRYVRMMRNLPHEGRGRARGAAVGALATGRKAAIFAVKAHILFGALMLWNRLMFPDEDKKINKNRRQLHLILGHRKDGTIISIRFEGALSDALEWFGLEDYPQDVADIRAGKKDWLDIASEAGKAPINRILQSWEPFSKTMFETILGRSSFPSFFEEGKSWRPRTRPIRNRLEHVARTVSMDWLVRKVSRLTKKPLPQRQSTVIPGAPENFGRFLDGVLLYRTDPGEAAYWHARDLVMQWQKKHGDEAPSITPTERANALYYHRKALMWGDEKAAEAWLKEYARLGGTAAGYRASIEGQHPLASLNEIKKRAFFSSLTPEEQEAIKEGVAWYQKVYGGGDGKP